MTPKPDMTKVLAFLDKIGSRPRAGKTHVEYPLAPSPPAQDSAIRKPLKAHGVKCPGFEHYQFLNRYD